MMAASDGGDASNVVQLGVLERRRSRKLVCSVAQRLQAEGQPFLWQETSYNNKEYVEIRQQKRRLATSMHPNT